MTARLVTVFGGNGFIGRHIVQRLVNEGARVRVACRDPEAALFLKPLGNPGQIVAVKANVANADEVARAVKGADAVVNCAGILKQFGRNSFENVHVVGSGVVAKAAAAAKVKSLVHISALGADEKSGSRYARSKAQGDAEVLAAYPQATILRPSIVLGADDNFLNTFAAVSRWSPVVPIIGCPILPQLKMVRAVGTQWLIPSFVFCGFSGTRFQPVYVGDVADAAMKALEGGKAQGNTYEITGPRPYTFRRLMELMLAAMGRKRFIVPYPTPLAYMNALFWEMVPGKPFTRDMVYMLKNDNLPSGSAKTIKDLGINPRGIESVLPTYLHTYGPPASRRVRDCEV